MLQASLSTADRDKGITRAQAESELSLKAAIGSRMLGVGIDEYRAYLAQFQADVFDHPALTGTDISRFEGARCVSILQGRRPSPGVAAGITQRYWGDRRMPGRKREL